MSSDPITGVFNDGYITEAYEAYRRDPDSQTFSALFPGTAYSGKIGLIGPSNVIDTTPTLRLRLHRRIYFLPEDSFFWRESRADGIYGVTGSLTRTVR